MFIQSNIETSCGELNSINSPTASFVNIIGYTFAMPLLSIGAICKKNT